MAGRVFIGTTQLAPALRPLVSAATTTLQLTPAPRARTIGRVAAGGGRLAAVNWVLEQDYQYHGKHYSSVRAARLAARVTRGVADPKVAGRECGGVREAPTAYVRPVIRVAVRCRKANGQWGYAVLVSRLGCAAVQALMAEVPATLGAEEAALLGYGYFYDGRGGGVESSLHEDKQGLGLTKRNKKRLEAQQIVVLLSSLAHNTLVWARAGVVAQAAPVAAYGLKRLMRDVWGMAGYLEFDHQGHIQRIVLNAAYRLTRALVNALRLLLGPEQVVITSGET